MLRGGRPAEVLAYVAAAKKGLESWVALDDVDLREPTGPSAPALAPGHFVHVDPRTGLTKDTNEK